MISVQGWLDRERLATRLLLQVHDELVLEAPASEVARVERELPVLMAGVAELSVPLVADVGSGANWEVAH
jgi:DNA polymerase-1